MRHVKVSKKVKKELDKLDGKGKSWQKSIIKSLEDELNTIEDIKKTFDPLSGDLKGYYKAKNRSLGIRIVFRIVSEDSIEIFKIGNTVDEEYDEAIEIIAAGRRDKVYKNASSRAEKNRRQEKSIERIIRRRRKNSDD